MHVLPGNFGNRNIQNVQILAPDQVQQEIQRSLEGFQDHFQRIRRDIEILGHVQHGSPRTTASGISAVAATA